jgi:outer membrane receptor protein involved in Fe transport
LGPVIFGLPATTAMMNKDWTSQLNTHSAFDTKVKRFAAGLDGTFGESSWTWDGYVQYGRTDRSQLVNDNRHLNAYNLAVDSVIDDRVGSATIGQPICRVTRDGVPVGALYDPLIATGCVPLNPFGTQTINAAAKAYAFGFLLETLRYEQQVAAFNTTGDLFAGFGAGAIKGAVGVEYRREKGRNIGSQNGAPDYVRTDYLIQYGESFAGIVDVYEGYVEANVPVFRDVPGAQRLEFDLSARESSYHNKGGLGTSGASSTRNMTTWKVSGIWDPVEWLRVRGSQSRDSRSPNFRELYYGQQIKAGGVFGFCGPDLGVPVDPCNWSLEGNTELKPEKSDTTTAGLVFTPGDHLPGFQFAADYFNIKITDAITQASVFRVLQGCQIGNLAEFCALLVPDVPGDFSSIRDLRALAYNGSGYKYKGVDFTGSYKLDLAEAGALNFRLIATRMLKQTSPNGFQPGATIDVLGQTGTSNNFLSDNQPSAKWIGNVSATYVKGPFTATAQLRYVSSGLADYRAAAVGDANYGALIPGSTTDRYVQLDTNSVPSYSVFALNSAYTFRDLSVVKSLQLWAGIDNLFDKDPPISTGDGFGGSANGGANAVFFDTIGRAFKVGVRAEF